MRSQIAARTRYPWLSCRGLKLSTERSKFEQRVNIDPRRSFDQSELPCSLISLMPPFSHGRRSLITASLVVPRTFPDAGRALLYIDHKHHVRPLHFLQAVARNSHTRNRHCIRWCQVHIREASAAADLLLVHFKCVTVRHFELLKVSKFHEAGAKARRLTVSGLSVGFTLVPSNKKRQLRMSLPWRSQNASMSFFSWVVRLILKKTSLLLSVTLMFKCSEA